MANDEAPRDSQPRGAMTGRFLRNADLARSVGWGLFYPPLHGALLAANAAVGWFVFAALMSFVYPRVMAWLAKRAGDPLAWTVGGLLFESAVLVTLAEVVGMDPVLLLVAAAIMVFNAGTTRGSGAAALVLGVFAVTFGLVFGRLRSAPEVTLPTSLHLALGALLMGYIVLTTHQAYVLLLRHIEAKRALAEQKRRLESLHTHLVETIVNPFVADDALLEIIGPELSAEQTERYRQRIRLRQRWESFGRQSRALAHDARNLMTPLVMISELLEARCSGLTQASASIADLNRAVGRLEELIARFARSPEEAPAKDESCAVQSVVTEVISLLESSAPEAVEIRFSNQVEPVGQHVALDATSLHRVVVNLCVNSIQAIGDDGTLELDLRPSLSEEAGRAERGGPCVTLSVRDDGAGMSEQVLSRIFEPYFTTKQDSGGTGLGLASAHALLTDSGGAILARSELGVGTELRIVLPSSQGPRAEPEGDRAAGGGA